MSQTETPPVESGEVTVETLAQKLDALGAQMDWLCTNLQSLFVFVQQVGQNGGGLRGMMHLLKKGTPEIPIQEVSSE